MIQAEKVGSTKGKELDEGTKKIKNLKAIIDDLKKKTYNTIQAEKVGSTKGKELKFEHK